MCKARVVPLTDADLSAARSELTDQLRDLDLPTDEITDDQVRNHALRSVAADAPDRLTPEELHQVLQMQEDGSKRIQELDIDWQTKQKAEEKHAPLTVAVLAELDRRGALIDVSPNPPASGTARSQWALERISALGALAWGGDTLRPRAVREWLRDQSVTALTDAGDDRPPFSVLKKTCARWSWSGSNVSEIWTLAFPPTPADLSRGRFEHDLVDRVVRKAAQLRAGGQDAEAAELNSLARTMVALLLMGEDDDVASELRRYADDQLSATRSSDPWRGAGWS